MTDAPGPTVMISTSGLRSLPKRGFPNTAGQKNIDDALTAELETAGIDVCRFEFLRDGKREVDTAIAGFLCGWSFRRAWYYWVATGPGLPPSYATPLHEANGQEVRVEGHCGCPSPLEWCKGFAVGSYHIDTPTGLKALADTLAACARDARPAVPLSALMP
jgi:hypothetical protein